MLRRQRPLWLLTTLAALACVASFVSPASAGTYPIKSCGQSPTRSMANWFYEETAGSSGGLPYFYRAMDCGNAGTYRRFEINGVGAGATAAWTFEAPAGTWVQSVQLFQNAIPRVAGAYDSVIAEMDDGGKRILASAYGTSGSKLSDATYPLPATGAHAIRIRSELGCGTSANCDGLSNWEYGNVWELFGSVMQVADPSTPSVNDASGPGWQAQPADGVSNISYSTSDAGSGISEVRFLVDGIQFAVNTSACTAGTPVPCPLAQSGTFVLDTTKLAEGAHTIALVAVDWSGNAMPATAKQLTITVRRPPKSSGTTPVSTTNPDANGGGSPAVGDHLHGNAGTWTGEAISYAYQWLRCDSSGVNCVPIAGATALTYVPTTTDIGRTLQFCVTASNSGGQATTCSPPTAVVIASHPTPATTADRPGQPTVVTTDGTTVPHGPERGSPNGSPAADRVVLTALVNNKYGTQKVKFGKRVPIGGRLIGPDGAPIKGATLAVQTQTAIPGASLADAAQVVTGTDGRFMYLAPAGPSRVIRLGYRSHTADASFADTTDVRLLVSAGVSMKAMPKVVRNRQATVFTGRLLGGPIPARGVVVDLQVFFRKQWRTFAAPRTNKAGAYKFKYRFMAGAATWKFRARVRQESSYPYELGLSAKPIQVKVVG